MTRIDALQGTPEGFSATVVEAWLASPKTKVVGAVVNPLPTLRLPLAHAPALAPYKVGMADTILCPVTIKVGEAMESWLRSVTEPEMVGLPEVPQASIP